MQWAEEEAVSESTNHLRSHKEVTQGRPRNVPEVREVNMTQVYGDADGGDQE